MKYLKILIILCLLLSVLSFAAHKEEPVKIVFYTPAEDASGAIRRLINKFNSENWRIKVEHKMLSSGSDDCRNYYVTACLSRDNSFDVFSGDIIWISEFASSGWIEPLDSFFPSAERDKFLPGPIEGCTYQERIWAVPWFTDSGVLFYRSDLIDKPPRTWKELISIAQKKIREGSVEYGYVFQGNQYEGLVCHVLELIWSNGGQILDGDTVKINTPEAIEGLQLLVDILNSGICPEEVVWYQEEDSRLFYQDGNALFLRNWPYAWLLMNQEGTKIRGKFKIAPLPIGPRGVKSSGCLGGWNLMINSQSKNKKEAWEFIEFLSSFPAQKIHSMVGGRLPTRISVYNDPEVLRINPYYKELLPNFMASKPRPVSPYYPVISENMQINFYKAITGVITAEEAITNIEREIKNIFAK